MIAFVIHYEVESEAKAAYETYRTYLRENTGEVEEVKDGGVVANEG